MIEIKEYLINPKSISYVKGEYNHYNAPYSTKIILTRKITICFYYYSIIVYCDSKDGYDSILNLLKREVENE